MKLSKIVLIAAAATLLAGCETKYKQQGSLGGGYTDFRVSTDKFVVSFRGNEYTTTDKTMKYALLRASEITVAHGFQFFIVETKEDISSENASALSEDLSSKDKKDENSIATNVSTNAKDRKKSGVRLHIKCFRNLPKDLDVIEAAQYLSFNKR